MAGLRATNAGLLASTSMVAPSRVSLVVQLITVPMFKPKRVTHHTQAGAVPMFGQERVTQHVEFIAGSIHQVFILDLLEADNDFPSAPIDLEIEVIDTLIPEWNPYRPRIPESLISAGNDFYDFYEENQNIHRQQHNLQQAGDTTFPWQKLGKSHTEKEYTLGSVSRFFHEQWGMIHARYVKFDFMVGTKWAWAPCGLIKNNDQHEWTVTNQLNLSDPDLVVGILATSTTPIDGEYGWVIIDGPNIFEVDNASEIASMGETFAWDSTGSVSNKAKGRVIGRRIHKVVDDSFIRLQPGQLYIQIESFSWPQLAEQIEAFTDDLRTQVADLQTDVDALKAITGIGNSFQQLSAKLTFMQQQLDAEKQQRQAADLAINQRIGNLDFVTAAALTAALSGLSGTINAALAALSARIDAISIPVTGDPFDRAFWDGQLTAILLLIAELRNLPRNKFPVVDGSVPPNLVYLPDGSLVYTES